MDEDKKAQEIFEKVLQEKLSGVKDEIKTAVVDELMAQKAKGAFGNDDNNQHETKSVMNTDLNTRNIAPFVSLSKKTEKFINGVFDYVKTGFNLQVIKAALNGEVDDEGGFLVPEEVENEIVRYMSEKSKIRPRATVKRTSGDSKSILALDQSSNQFSGVTLYWIGQSDLKVESEPTFSRMKLVLNKLIGLTAVTDELTDDTPVNILNFLVTLYSEAIAYEEDNQFINGTGTGQPMGIINSPLTDSISRDTDGEVNVQDFYNLDDEIPEQLEEGLVWMMRKTTMNSLRGKRAAVYNGSTTVETGGFLLQENYSQKGLPTILGYPVLLSGKMPAKGSKGDVVLARLKGYTILDKKAGGIAVDTSMHDRFRYDEQTLRLVKRVDGQVTQRKSFVMLNA